MSEYESGYDSNYGYNRNAFAHKTPVTAILGKTVQLIASPIGLISEAIHRHKEKGNNQSSSDVNITENTPAVVSLPPEDADKLVASGQAVSADGKEATHELVPDSKDYDAIERDEADWALDEAVLEMEESVADSSIVKDEQERVKSSNNEKSPGKGVAFGFQKTPLNLPFPVILPQRRPGTKARGFVRAYAPVLEEQGINQETFLNFLKDFHKAAQASPIFDVIMVATALASAYPDPIVGLGLLAVQVAVGIGQEAQERYRLNKFLTQANKDLFNPKGLFVLVVAYKKSDSAQPEVSTKTVDLGATAIVKYGEELLPSGSPIEEQDKEIKKDELKAKMKQFRVASGETHGEAEMPVICAPLIFPALDAEVGIGQTNSESNTETVTSKIKAKSKSASKFVSDYYDRRAQATYAAENPNSTLTAQVSPIAPQFKSRFADPNNQTNKHLFTLITGGKFKAEPLGARRRYERAQQKAAERRAQGIRERQTKRLLQENVLYLMVVNMPTQQELDVAKKQIQKAKELKAVE